MLDNARTYTSRRSAIVSALCRELKKIDGRNSFLSDLGRNVYDTLKFWDEVKTFPSVHVVSGSERREYQGNGFKDRYLNVSIWVYVDSPHNSTTELDKILEDIETVLEENSQLEYTDKQGSLQRTHLININEIVTDEGALNTEGLAVGEILLEVRY